MRPGAGRGAAARIRPYNRPMTPASRRTSPLLLLAGAALAVAVTALVAFGALLPALTEDKAETRPAARTVTAADVDAAMTRATQALGARDPAAWEAALPAEGGDARRAVDALYRHLVRLPWTSVRLVAEPVRGHPGRFYVGAVGELGGADPADRIMARRVFDVSLRGGGLVLLHDVTPRDVRGQEIMAFRRPVAVRRNGLIVIADKSEQSGAEELARAGGPARERLTLLGIASRRPVVVYYYSSRAELVRSLGEDPDEPRIRFFSHPPAHLGDAPSWTRDIGVLAPALAGKESWTPQMLAHELTHAYTTRWFQGTKHAPTLLAEGLATAVEGGRTFQPLRDDLAAESFGVPAGEGSAREEPLEGQPHRQGPARVPGGCFARPLRDGPLGPARPEELRHGRQRFRPDGRGARPGVAPERGRELGRTAHGLDGLRADAPVGSARQTTDSVR